MPTFAVGARVRVKAGTTDPENPDLPIGLWCGTIDEIDFGESPVSYAVLWDGRTCAHMHPIFVKRCRTEELETDSMWLEEDQLEVDDGARLPLEKPTGLVSQPFDQPDPDQRLRAVFGLGPEEAIPDVDEFSVRLYHAHLHAHMAFPFEADWGVPAIGAAPRHVTVVGLMSAGMAPPGDGVLVEVETQDQTGILPLQLLERDPESPQGRLLADYVRWIKNWHRNPVVLPGSSEARAGIPLRRLLHYSALTGAVYGATLGSITAVMDGARLGMLIGTIVFALLLGMLGRRWGMIVGLLKGFRNGPLLGLALGAILGGVFGVLLGALAVAFVGAIPGSILGSLVTGTVMRRGPKARLLGTLLGGCAGGMVSALIVNHETALAGMFIGTLIGITAGLFVVLAALVTLSLLMGRRA